MSYRLSGINPLAYIGVEPLTPPAMIVQPRSPTSGDSKGYNLGSLWLVAAPPPTQNWELWILVDLTAGIATWVQLYPDSAAGVIRLDADVGFAIPTLGIINVLGGPNINTFGDTADNLFINLNESIRLPNTSSDGSQGVLFLGAVGGVGGDTFLHNYGSDNTFLGQLAGNLTLNAGLASANTGIGNNSLRALTTGALNTSLGEANLQSLTTGDANVSLGASSLQNLVTGSNNISIGINASQNYSGAESSNIIIGNDAVLGESHTIRIGTDGVGDGQQDAAYMAGVYGRAVGGVNQTVIIDNTGKLGSSSTVSNGVIITTFDASGVWNKNPGTKLVRVILYNGGSGGGSGARGLTFVSPQCSTGGGGGGSGSVTITDQMLADFFNAAEPVIVGAGGLGGVPQVANNTAGNNGNPGGVSTFATNIGLQSTDSGRGGLINNIIGGNAANTSVRAYNYGIAVTGFINTAGNVASVPGSGRANTGNNAQGTGGVPGGLGTSGFGQWASTGGGGGGGADITTPWAGGNGGIISSVVNTGPGTLLVAGGAGGIESGTIDGSNGIDFATPTSYFWYGATGGGGGGGQSTGLVAGNGGTGGIPGGGGGGGGASLNGTASGAGGDGGQGRVIVIEYL